MLTRGNTLALWLLLLLRVCDGAFSFAQFNSQPQEGDVRLAGSKSRAQGRVEVYHDGRWGTVCDDGWDLAEAQVLCRQLRFPGAKSVQSSQQYAEGSGPIWMDDTDCKGTEKHLLSCSFKGWGQTDCTHKEDVAVICETDNVDSGDSQYAVDHSFMLSSDLGQIFDHGEGCDFHITVKSGTGVRAENGTEAEVETRICVHRLMLLPFPFFNASRVSNITVDVSLTCQQHFSSFIRYLYTRKMVVTMHSVHCLHWMASQFGVKPLMESTALLFSEVLPEDTLFHTQLSIFNYAQDTQDLVLRENCLQYLAWNYQNLTRSPAWTDVSAELARLLLSRSDLVVPDEYFVLQSVEKWIEGRGPSVALDLQADLLKHIRFPLIPVEKLYTLQTNSSLYSTHQKLYGEQMLKAFQFNFLLFSNLLTSPSFDRDDDGYRPRLYTGKPWGVAINPGFSDRSFSTPLHTSLIFKSTTMHWGSRIYRNRYECSNHGISCKSLPMARLVGQNSFSKNVLFRNQLLLSCQGKYICHIQDFKSNHAYISENSTHGLTYPCPDKDYTYLFVVRAEYV